MPRSLRLAVCLLFFCSWLAGPVQAFDATRYDKGLLWKVERSGTPPSYVFGTVHSEDARVLALPPAVKQAFDGCSRYVMEAVMDDAAVQSMTQRMMFDESRTLQQVLGASLYARTTSALAAYGMPEFAAQKMKPWAVAMSLSMPKPQTGVFLDLLLMQYATEQGKSVAGLESVDEQLAIFDRMPMTDQITMLRDTLDYLPELDGMFAELHELYLARDLGGLARLSEEQQLKGDRELAKRVMAQLLDDRNRRMVARMDAHLKQGNAFIAVGALHLPGRKGVLNLLAQKGYRISAIY